MCGECETVVHDLSAMTEKEARATLEATSGRLCVRYIHDTTGKVWFKEDLAHASLISSSRLTKGAGRAFALASAMAAFALAEACGGHDGGRYYETIDGGADASDASSDVSSDAQADAGLADAVATDK